METSKLNIKRKGDEIGIGYIDEAWLMNRFEYADTSNPITQSLYCCLSEVLNIHHYNTQNLRYKTSHAEEQRVQVEFI